MSKLQIIIQENVCFSVVDLLKRQGNDYRTWHPVRVTSRGREGLLLVLLLILILAVGVNPSPK